MEVKVNQETASETVIRMANAPVKVTDSGGRRITIRKLQTLDRLRLFELVGPENSENERYLGYASLAYSVVAIDEIAVATVTKKLQLEALVQRLGDEGFDAVAKGVSESFLVNEKTDAEIKESVKNE